VDIILWGSGGQAIVLRELLEPDGYRIAALFDNDPAALSPFEGVPLYHGVAGFEDWLHTSSRSDFQGLAAIGDNVDRVEVHELFVSRGIRLAQAIHRTAFIAGDAVIGQGAQILARATVCTRVVVGDSVLVNTAASVDHECVLGRGAQVGPGAVLAGGVTLEEYAFVGAGAVVLPRISIGSNSTVGAGALVTKNVPPGIVVAGNPARPHLTQKEG
jgi:sugar O-acyltransferase (sialic acid O-acetyltransferase NeuD family)